MMNIQKVHFYRTEKDKKQGKGEEGIIINEGDGVIVDAKGQAVSAPIWDYTIRPWELCINIPIAGEDKA